MGGFVVKKGGVEGVTVNESPKVTLLQFDSATTLTTLAGDASIGTTSANTAIGATNALQLDGTGDYASVALCSLGVPANWAFCIEIWARTTVALSSTHVGIVEWVDGSGGSWGIFHYGTNSAIQSTRNGGSSFGSGTLTQNQWGHIAWCRNVAGNQAVFIDGTRAGTASSTTAFGGSASGTLYVGRNNAAFSGNDFTGQLHALRVSIGYSFYDPTQTTLTVPTTLFKFTA